MLNKQVDLELGTSEITAGCSDCGLVAQIERDPSRRALPSQWRALLGIELLRTPTELRLQLPQEMTQAVNLRQRLARSTVCNVAVSVPTAIRTIALPITISITGDPPGCAGAIGTSKHGGAVSTVTDTITALVFPPSPRSPAPPD